ncbi:MAG: MBOAT family protein [Oscillospiraceae bacterium]|nr:MBOAT family protein [Oscillospiraceae bacterium]
MGMISYRSMLIVICSLIVFFNIKKRQWIVLLLTSLIVFVAFSGIGAAVYALITIVTVHLAANLMKKYPAYKKKLLIGTLVINFALLAGLRYTLFEDVFSFYLDEIKTFAVPIGISYYTFQMMSYLLDCYWEVTEPEKNIFKTALFCLYFPLLLSGPICRYDKLAPQFYEEHRFDYHRVSYGLIRVAYGLFEKLVVADRLDANILDVPNMILIPILIFPLQLYADFDGCMNIIMGVSECFGIVPEENFRAPFYAKTIQEFWQRWHITLGVWMKNYIMYPLLKSERFIRIGEKLKARFGKKTGKQLTTWTATLVVWICTGIWHGKGIKFVFGQGLWFWLVIVIEQIAESRSKKRSAKGEQKADSRIINGLRVIRTYLLYCFGTIFFQAPTFPEAIGWITSMVKDPYIIVNSIVHIPSIFINDFYLDALALIGLAVMAAVDVFRYRGECVRDLLHKKNYAFRLACYWLMSAMIILSLNQSAQEFLYSQF